MHKYITLAVVFVLLSLPILAQKTISGLVLDSENREPLIGVTVVVENSNAGTITDVDGSYSIQITQEDSKITFSYLGYEELTLKVDQNDFSTIYLKSGFKLDEVIVTALGLERSSRDLGYARLRSRSEERPPSLIIIRFL